MPLVYRLYPLVPAFALDYLLVMSYFMMNCNGKKLTYLCFQFAKHSNIIVQVLCHLTFHIYNINTVPCKGDITCFVGVIILAANRGSVHETIKAVICPEVSMKLVQFHFYQSVFSFHGRKDQ